MATISPLQPGTAPIKAEFRLSTATREVIDDDSAERTTSHADSRANAGSASATVENGDGEEEGGDPERPAKRQRMSKEDKKKRKGANKGRRFGKMRDEVELCWKTAKGETCNFGDKCRYTHDILHYLSEKPGDITFPSSVDALLDPTLEQSAAASKSAPETDLPSSVNPLTECPVFVERGECRLGFKCRFLGGHLRKSPSGQLELLKDEDEIKNNKDAAGERNFLPGETLKLLRTKKYPQPLTDAYLKELADAEKKGNKATVSAAGGDQGVDSAAVFTENGKLVEASTDKTALEATEGETDTPDVPLRPSERKRLHWKGLTYLAPLTTVGNLPFRQLCVTLGADITCGEMGLATSFLQGSKEEWSLVRRHPSERIFGTQLAGSKPATLVPVAECVAKEFGYGENGMNFVDVNCGCPIDLVFRAGSGSALLDAPGKLSKILNGMDRVLGDIPLTVKLRTGVKEGKNSAHKLMPRLATETGVAAMTLHGRTRQQRYTKLADWDYIRECVQAVRQREEEEGLPQIPIFGGGDAFSSHGYWESVERGQVDGVMVARGALIKPWIFTEIKEKREWDISARERLELARKYAEFGLNHFGSDTAGVNTTRRYLCEALSFTHRYIPIGLLEVLPGQLNDRPPAFKGRNELETLLASPDSRDWVRISEMFLGKCPDGWSFTPKHKSNAYGVEEGQG